MRMPWTSRLATPTAYFTNFWDERLYECYFAGTTDPENFRKHRFEVVLDSRYSEFSHAASREIEHKYKGAYKLWLSELEYTEIVVTLELRKPDSYYDVYINRFRAGSMTFSYVMQSRPVPLIEVVLRDESGVSENLNRLFLDSKLLLLRGPTLQWHADLRSIKGMSASAVWGDWSSEFLGKASDQEKQPEYPGRQGFPLEDFTISVGER